MPDFIFCVGATYAINVAPIQKIKSGNDIFPKQNNTLSLLNQRE